MILKNFFVLAAPPAMDPWNMTYINDPQQTYKRVHGLAENTSYLILIRAETRAGKGPEKSIEATTVSVAGVKYLSLCVFHHFHVLLLSFIIC